MSSGYGLHGGKQPETSQWAPDHAKIHRLTFFAGPGRCFPFWQELLACYVVNTSGEDDSGKSKCAPVLEDYYECLHHKKEVRRPGTAEAIGEGRSALTDSC